MTVTKKLWLGVGAFALLVIVVSLSQNSTSPLSVPAEYTQKTSPSPAVLVIQARSDSILRILTPDLGSRLSYGDFSAVRYSAGTRPELSAETGNCRREGFPRIAQ
jgi:hypothetical protein